MNSLSSQCDVEARVAGSIRVSRWVSMLVVLALAAGCATMGRTPEDQVRARAKARWDLLLAGDFRGAYQFFSPGSRAGYTEDEFQLSIRRGFWKSADVKKVVCAGADTCESEVVVEYEFGGMRSGSPLRETWVRDRGQWWYLRK